MSTTNILPEIIPPGETCFKNKTFYIGVGIFSIVIICLIIAIIVLTKGYRNTKEKKNITPVPIKEINQPEKYFYNMGNFIK